MKSFLLLFLACSAASRAQPVGELKPQSLRVGFTCSVFLNMNRNDLEASFKGFTMVLGRKCGYLIDPQSHVYDSSKEFEAAIKAGAIDLAIIDTWKFLEMDIRTQMEPLFVSTSPEGIGRRYLVLTSKSSGLRSIPQLQGKSIAECVDGNANLGANWLETLLRTNQLGNQETFFGTVETVVKPSAAVLPVFFGKKDACLLDQAGFDLMTEMNPQVGQALQVLAVSEPLANTILCLRKSPWEAEAFRQTLVKILSELHLDPAGQQLLTMFKTGPLVPFKEAHLATVRELRARAGLTEGTAALSRASTNAANAIAEPGL
jgi:phosphonate transport system substrate-binding protein